MKVLYFLLIIVALASCKPVGERALLPGEKYLVSLVAVKVPDDVLKQHGGELNAGGIDFHNSRKEFASYVSENLDKFASTQISGNCIPLVRNNQQTHARLLFDQAQEEKDFQVHGLKVDKIDVSLYLGESNSSDQVSCHWRCWVDVERVALSGDAADLPSGGWPGVGGNVLTVG